MPYFPRAGVPFFRFIKRGEIGGRATNIPFFKSASGQRTFYYRIVSIWNWNSLRLKMKNRYNAFSEIIGTDYIYLIN